MNEQIFSPVQENTIRTIVREEVQGIERQIQDLDSRVQGVEGQIQGLDGRVQSLENKVQKLDERVQSLDDKVQKLDEKVQNIEITVQKLTDTVIEHSELLHQFNDRLDRTLTVDVFLSTMDKYFGEHQRIDTEVTFMSDRSRVHHDAIDVLQKTSKKHEKDIGSIKKHINMV